MKNKNPTQKKREIKKILNKIMMLIAYSNLDDVDIYDLLSRLLYFHSQIVQDSVDEFEKKHPYGIKVKS